MLGTCFKWYGAGIYNHKVAPSQGLPQLCQAQLDLIEVRKI